MKDESGALTRREFVAVSAAATAAVATGCATNPVTGKSQLMLVSEASELEMDKKWAPHQFSSDYGTVQDDDLNAYIREVGGKLVPVCHRPHMPYSFRVLNTPVVNGYTLPAGSVGLARGLMVEMKTESELAAVLGHEVGHVCYKHSASRMTQSMMLNAGVVLLAAYLEYEKKKYAGAAAGLGMIGANMLLCRYSRDDEREADEVGMEYMVKAEFNPKGMAGLMETFMNLHKSKPSTVDLLFATHPMSDERYKTAVERMNSRYQDALKNKELTERYMDRTAKLRAIKPAIEDMQNGEMAMMKEKYADAQGLFGSALKKVPGDYAATLMMSKCLLAQHKNGEAERYAEEARKIYPAEAQAIHVAGMTKLSGTKFEAALQDFNKYWEVLPGNANTIFYKGVCNDKMGRRDAAVREYKQYLSEAPGGEYAEQAQRRLIEWGVLAPPQQPQQNQGKKK